MTEPLHEKRKVPSSSGLLGFWAVTAQGISRVGNSMIGDTALGFEMPFREHSPSGAEGFWIENNPNSKTLFLKTYARKTSSFSPPFLYLVIKELKESSELAKKNRSDFQRAIVEGWGGQTWNRMHSEDSCLELYWASGDSAMTGIAAWGQEKSFVIVGMKDPYLLKNIQDMLAGLRLYEGACEWK